jgi:hypothetical protein
MAACMAGGSCSSNFIAAAMAPDPTPPGASKEERSAYAALPIFELDLKKFGMLILKRLGREFTILPNLLLPVAKGQHIALLRV